MPKLILNAGNACNKCKPMTPNGTRALYGLGVELAFRGEVPVLAWSGTLRKKLSHVSSPCSPSALHSWADSLCCQKGPSMRQRSSGVWWWGVLCTEGLGRSKQAATPSVPWCAHSWSLCSTQSSHISFKQVPALL